MKYGYTYTFSYKGKKVGGDRQPIIILTERTNTEIKGINLNLFRPRQKTKEIIKFFNENIYLKHQNETFSLEILKEIEQFEIAQMLYQGFVEQQILSFKTLFHQMSSAFRVYNIKNIKGGLLGVKYVKPSLIYA